MFRTAGVAVLLSAFLISCGGSDRPASDTASTETSEEAVSLSPPKPFADRAADSVTEESRDQAIYSEYVQMVVDVSANEVDSLAKAVMAKGLKPDKMMAEMERGMERLRARKETTIREKLAQRFAISVDSVSAVIKRKDAEQERTMEERTSAENDTSAVSAGK